VHCWIVRRKADETARDYLYRGSPTRISGFMLVQVLSRPRRADLWPSDISGVTTRRKR
jgi:hypothetical protein